MSPNFYPKDRFNAVPGKVGKWGIDSTIIVKQTGIKDYNLISVVQTHKGKNIHITTFVATDRKLGKIVDNGFWLFPTRDIR